MTTPAPNPEFPALPDSEAHSRFIKILEATTDVVAMMDRTGKLLYLNTAGRRMFGWQDGEDLSSRSLHEMHPPWAFEVVRHESIPTAVEIGYWSGETALNSSSGRETPILQVVLAHTTADGEVEFLSTICRDISDRKQKELEHIEWANRYDAAIRASGQVLFDWDSSSAEITYAGDVEQLLGYSIAEMAGGLNRLRELVSPEDLDDFNKAIEAVLLTKDPFVHEFRLVRKNGVEIIVNAQGFFFLDRKGRIGRMVGFLKNVTVERSAETAVQIANERLEQRVAERTEALKQAAAELQDNARQQEAVARLGQSALAGTDLQSLMQESVKVVRTVLRMDMTSVLEFIADEGVFHLHAKDGWPHREEISIPVGRASQSGYTLLCGEAVVSPDFAKEERFEPSKLVLEAGCRSGLSVSIQAGDRLLGVLCAFSRNARNYSADEVSFLHGVANVLTSAIERHRVEEDARAAQAQAEAANRAKSEFLSRMSHELRTPLNAILGFTQLLEMDEHTPTQAESIHHISRAGQNLLTMINEVLDIARIESGRVQFQIDTIEVAPLLRDAAQFSESLAQRHGVTIRVAEDLPSNAFVSADQERLKQVLLNLISNAIKYNRENGSVTLRIEAHGVDAWRILVADTGHGIQESQLSRLFLPFERSGTPEAGIGLGLAICNRLVTALGGKIGATSTVGKGSTFWIEFPSVAPPVSDAPPSEPGQVGARKGRKLLYIEDDLANFYLLERILQSRDDIELISALQASLGLDLAREHFPDAILLDLNLPDMPGEQVLRALKSNPDTAHIPVIAITGEVAGERPETIRKLGAVDLLSKPYRVQELLTLLDRVLT